MLRDQRQSFENPATGPLLKGFPREGWIDAETGLSLTLHQWVVHHLLSHSYVIVVVVVVAAVAVVDVVVALVDVVVALAACVAACP